MEQVISLGRTRETELVVIRRLGACDVLTRRAGELELTDGERVFSVNVTDAVLDLAFGLHGCVGKPMARIEGGALAHKVGRIELSEEPERHLNNSVRSFESLRVTFRAP